ncbi:PEP-CTERM sorting domain-containing protein [Sandarakinorhabdus sp.]|uniref:PEP-CTERM sorting domain-containing protein n=1 Tax=Sandarakinorhabdus sp. TaxID=1916663 RepID=UPI00286E31EC|nr:PEP-CTERM sorting domain-containing protein [Sandarakinorhabdus sp.]
MSSAADATVTIAINSLFNTGVNSSKVALGTSAADPNWRLVAAPSGVPLGTVYTTANNGSFPIGPWLANTAISRWITPTNTLNHAPGTYTYELTFVLTPKSIANTARFTGRYAIDNRLANVTLNGNVIATGPASGSQFASWNAFSAVNGFVAGVNKLRFTTVNDAGGTGNPAGLQVQFVTSGVEVLPEPGVWVGMIIGFGFVGAAMRRRSPVAA